MITDHVYRPTLAPGPNRPRTACAYMNCRRPAGEHDRVSSASAVRAAANRR